MLENPPLNPLGNVWTIIVQRSWERRYLRYFVALGAGFMLATALVEMVPESLELRGRGAACLITIASVDGDAYYPLRVAKESIKSTFNA